MTDEKTPTLDEQLEEIRERIDELGHILPGLKDWVINTEKRLDALERDLRKRMPMR